MERAAAPAVERAPRGDAVDCHHRDALDLIAEGGDEVAEGGLEPARIEQPEQARKMSWRDTPPASRKKPRRIRSLARPNTAMSTQVSAPHKVAESAMSRFSRSSWRWAARARARQSANLRLKLLHDAAPLATEVARSEHPADDKDHFAP